MKTSFIIYYICWNFFEGNILLPVPYGQIFGIGSPIVITWYFIKKLKKEEWELALILRVAVCCRHLDSYLLHRLVYHLESNRQMGSLLRE